MEESVRANMHSSAAVRRRRRRRVTDENRKRAPRACDRCKSRKSKCVESINGKCERCFSSNLDCKFDREKSPHMETSFQPTPAAVLPQTSQAPDHPVIPQTTSTESHELLSPDSALSQGLAKHVIADQSRKVPWPNILSRLREAFSLAPQAAPEERDMVAMQARMTRPREMHHSEMTRLRAVIDAFPPRPIADFLLSVFINHATDTFFYFDQDQFLTDLDQFYTSPTPLRSDAGFVCLAMATFALGSQWTPLERPEGWNASQLPEPVDLGRVFYRHAKTIIPDIIDRPCLRSIQATFVLGVYLMPASAIGTSYVYMGLALRKALASDLHIQSDDMGMSEREREVRRRSWWSIYSLERCTTIKLNRPRTISAEIITIQPPAPCVQLDRLQRYDNIQFQMAYTRLIGILDKVADLGDGLTNPDELSRCLALESELKDWKNSLPHDFTLDNFSPKAPQYRTIFHLYLNYYYARITMGKVALVTLARTRLRQHLDPRDPPPQLSKTVMDLSKSCAKSAAKLIQLFESISKTQNITRFSFTDFQGCSIATIVTLVAGILERDSGYVARVKFGLDCLRKMASGNMTAKIGVRFVEAVQSITNEAAEKLNYAASSNHEMSVASSASSYDQWAEWITRQESHPIDQNIPAYETSSSNAPHGHHPINTWQIPELRENMPSGQPTEPLFNLMERGLDDAVTPGMSAAYERELFSGLHTDDHTFLMGLTGLDALDFSGLTDSLE